MIVAAVKIDSPGMDVYRSRQIDESARHLAAIAVARAQCFSRRGPQKRAAVVTGLLKCHALPQVIAQGDHSRTVVFGAGCLNYLCGDVFDVSAFLVLPA